MGRPVLQERDATLTCGTEPKKGFRKRPSKYEDVFRMDLSVIRLGPVTVSLPEIVLV